MYQKQPSEAPCKAAGRWGPDVEGSRGKAPGKGFGVLGPRLWGSGSLGPRLLGVEVQGLGFEVSRL